MLRIIILPLLVVGYTLIKHLRQWRKQPQETSSANSTPFIDIGKKRIAVHAIVLTVALLVSRTALSASDRSSTTNGILLDLLSPVPEALIEDSAIPSAPQPTTPEDAALASVDPELLQLFVYDEEEGEQEFADSTNTGAIESPTILPGASPQRTEIVEYIVREGDTVSSIAESFGVSINTILLENNLTSTSLIRPERSLRILPTTGISYTVVKGDTVDSIARKTNADADAIRSTNALSDRTLAIGEKLVIPNGRIIRAPLAASQRNRASRERFIAPVNLDISDIVGLVWPTVSRHINQYFTWRHYGVDIKGVKGTPIYAANDGSVALSGWNRGGYGQQVVLKHNNNVLSRYAHMSKILVSPGQAVAKGQVIGLVGSTGRSTGAHLHYEIIKNGKRVNPLNLY